MIELEQQNTLRILGSNTIENICIDVRRNVRDYSHYMISIVDNARDVIVKNCHFVGGYNVITSYSIHYTKLYDRFSWPQHLAVHCRQCVRRGDALRL